MQEEKSTNPDTERCKKTLSMVIVDQFTNHLILSVFIVLILIIIVPMLFINGLMFYYNNSTEAEMHVTASSNLLIAFVTTLYVALTWGLVSETRKMRKIQTEPNVYLFIEPRNVHNDITDFFIQNIGMGAAFNIKFNVLSDYIYGESKIDNEGKPRYKILRASEALILKDGIKYLAPTQKKRLFSTMFYKVKELNLQNNLDNHLKIHIRYEDNIGIEKGEDFTMSFYEVPANGIGELTKFERDFLKELNEIKIEIHNISTKIENLDEDSN